MSVAVGPRGPMLSFGRNSPNEPGSSKVTPPKDHTWPSNQKGPRTKSQHDFNHLASSLRNSSVIDYEVHCKTIDDHTSNHKK